ncbi:MAG: DUF2911 domain-containing protein [Bacteroidetes bacterium]|nr:DUF2911 domain-containing protein [Bacteroidota bacterium]
MRTKKIIHNLFLIIGLMIFVVSISNAQQNKKSMQSNKKGMQENLQGKNDWHKVVRVSPKASITETIGLTDVTVSYSRPGVKGRKIWGGLVPYDKVWRAGANEATKITFGSDVWIEGKKLPAGSYGFFVIPREKDWTVIFNKVADQWGAFEYNESEDAMRVNIKPQSRNFQEWLSYTFSDLKVNAHGKNSGILNLNWEKVRLPITIETDVK